MASIRDLTLEILRREGGYVNDPDDPGGATNYGVTIHTMRRLGLDLDSDGDIDVSDVRALTLDQAAEVFERDYLKKPGIHKLPDGLQASVYDMSVNSGSRGIKLLQSLVGKFGVPIAVDGVLGPKSFSAIAKVYDMAPNHVADAYGIERRNFYYRLGDQRPKLRKFARRRDGGKGGWIIRAEEFISPRFHFSNTEHRQRVSAWV
ncbi:MAG: holin-associated N-acetylmuramidase [Pseudomonadota bacterium]